MSSSRLARLHDEIQRFIDEGKHAAAVSLIARNGKIVDWRAYGRRDLELVQHFPYDQHEIFWRFSTLAYAAIVD